MTINGEKPVRFQWLLIPLVMVLALAVAPSSQARVAPSKADGIVWKTVATSRGAATGVCGVTTIGGIACYHWKIPKKRKLTFFNLKKTGKTFRRSQINMDKDSTYKSIGTKRRWTRNGVSCKRNARKGIRCTNRSGHGFQLNPLSLTFSTF